MAPAGTPASRSGLRPSELWQNAVKRTVLHVGFPLILVVSLAFIISGVRSFGVRPGQAEVPHFVTFFCKKDGPPESITEAAPSIEATSQTELVSDGGEEQVSNMKLLPPHRVTHVWPRPHYQLSGHNTHPDRPHTVVLGAASYALNIDPGAADVSEVRVLTTQKWALSYKDEEYARLYFQDLLDMSWQCLLCFGEPFPWEENAETEKWPGVKVNGSGEGHLGHPQIETTRAELDLACRRYSVTRLEDYRLRYNLRFGGDYEHIMYVCEIPAGVLQESDKQNGKEAHGWISLIEGNWTHEEVTAHFGEPASLNLFAALRDLTPPQAPQPLAGAPANASHPLRLSGCGTVPLFRTASWPPVKRDVLMEHLAWNKLNGMHKMRLYLARDEDMAPWLPPLLDYFAQDGFLEVLEWLPGGPVSVANSDYYGQLLLNYDCMHRAAVDSDWTLFGDFDELVASNTVAHRSWTDTFGPYFFDPTIGLIQLRSWFIMADCASAGEGMKDLVSSLSVYRKPDAEEANVRSKFWIRPAAGTWIYTHFAGLREGFKQVEIDPLRAHIRHYLLRRKDLIQVKQCTQEAMKAAGLQAEYSFPLLHQEALWAEVEAARRYLSFALDDPSAVHQEPALGLPLMELPDAHVTNPP